MKWEEMTINEYNAALASSSPTPGGGTAAAIALGQACALTCMVCDLTIGKEKWQDGWEAAENALEIAVPMMSKGNQLANEDSDAFDQVMASFSLPKSTDEEKDARRTAIRTATLKAAEVPYSTAINGVKLLRILPELARKGNANAVTDIGVASLLASTAAKGALFNVEINLDSLPEGWGEDIKGSMEDIWSEVRTLSRECMKAVRARMQE